MSRLGLIALLALAGWAIVFVVVYVILALAGVA